MKFPTGSEVCYKGELWVVVSVYFTRRKLVSMDGSKTIIVVASEIEV